MSESAQTWILNSPQKTWLKIQASVSADLYGAGDADVSISATSWTVADTNQHLRIPDNAQFIPRGRPTGFSERPLVVRGWDQERSEDH